jgi:hypothetical protein
MSNSSPYKNRPMANTVEMQISEGCKSYDLYITSEFRRSMFVEGKMKDGDTTLRISTLNMMYNKDREKYDKMIKDMKDKGKANKMLFLGVSNDAFIFIAAGQVIVDTVNTYLESYEQGARVARVVLTKEIGEHDPPKCYPLRQPKAPRYRHAPATHSPNEWAWEHHLSEYYVDNPEMYYLPSPVKISIDTVIDGVKIVANVKGV